MVPLFSFSVKYEEAVGRVVGWPGLLALADEALE